MHAEIRNMHAKNGSSLGEKIRNQNLRNVADESTQTKTSSLDAKLAFLNTCPPLL